MINLKRAKTAITQNMFEIQLKLYLTQVLSQDMKLA